ncbi:hypothetical protein FEM03_00685 [Phragmitibacter flavus]|uniref:Tetratricopeptide repeat protein n=1 Tax=Phragmitibacter flavus TaxID=2576071 RepID=A0A5R8KJY0_9BACT|nr:hypothetical protein [Phragmitibacter flavus]TLD72626.1 hypothetical protein FEM03_00685 [Phragmitibacter flavus]
MLALIWPSSTSAQSFREQAREAASRGDNQQAVALFEKALTSAMLIFKEGDIELTIRRAELGEAYRAEGRWDDAIAQLKYAWERSKYDATLTKRWNGHEGDMAMSCAEKLARCYQGAGQYENTIKTLQVALDDNVKHGRRLEEGTHFLAMLTDMFLLLNREDEATEAAKEVMEITELTAEENPVHTARVCSVMGGIYLNHQRIDQARILLQRSVRLAAQHLPPADKDRLRVQQQLASILIQDGKLDEAELLLNDTITQSKNSDSADMKILVAAHLALGNAALKKGNPEDVLQHTEDARVLCEKHFSKEHSEYARCFLLSGLARVDLRQRDAARKDLEIAYGVLVKALGQDHPDSTTVKRALDELSSNTVTADPTLKKTP